uniref:Band 4.1 domain-containing protein n=1 Tax=Ascaris lumbricoides TaxID=6252 RepID=A0A9J2P4J0_ASCLU
MSSSILATLLRSFFCACSCNLLVSPLFCPFRKQSSEEASNKSQHLDRLIPRKALRSSKTSLLKFADQMESTSLTADKDSLDSHLACLLHRVLHTAITQYQSSTPKYRRARKQQLIGTLSSLTTFCFIFLQKGGINRRFGALNTLNKIIDTGLVHGLFTVPPIVFHSSRLLNRTHDFQYAEVEQSLTSISSNSKEEQGWAVDHPLPHSTPPVSGATGATLPCESSPHKIEADLTSTFSNVDPSLVIACLHNAITMQNHEAGSRSVCSPAHRWRQCWQHCTQILVARLLLFLCHIRTFQTRLSEQAQLRTLVQLLKPTLDPQLLCLLLQSIAVIALNPNTHRLFIDMQIDDVLIQMLLPADDWYYTNHSTKFGQFVKYHAARILIYVGMGDRVGSCVSLFHFPENAAENKEAASYANEDDYICETCSTPSTMRSFSRCAMSVEGILQNVLAELVKNSQHAGATEPITEEPRSATLPLPIGALPNNHDGVSKPTQQMGEEPSAMQISLENLEAQLCKLGLVLDTILLLRLLLHKLSWDLSLVVKNRVALFDNHTRKTISDSRAGSSCSFVKSKSFDRRDDSRKDRNFMRVDQGSRMSKRVYIRRSSSVEIPRTKRFSSGATDLKAKERRKRLGTNTSSGSNRSKKTSSSRSSVQKHLPKYIQSFFRGRMSTDPCKRHARRDSSPESNTSGSDAVLEFARKLQNYPLTRREALRHAYWQNEQQDSIGEKQKSSGYGYLTELEINGASPTRHDSSLGVSLLSDRRQSSPQVVPSLPLIEIRRPSALSQFELGNFVNSPDMTGSEASECAPLLMKSSNGTQISSRKSSDENSMDCWSSRASSALSRRSSNGGLHFSTFSAGTSIASDKSGPFLLSFVLRKRATTVGTRIPLPKRAISRSSSDSLRVPEGENPLHPVTTIEVNPDFQCVRQLILNLLTVYSKQNTNVISAMKESADVLRQILNSPQHPAVKNWCAEIIHVVSTLVFQDQIISGSLPCPKEEAALLASIQLYVEENWPSNKRTQTIRRHLLRGQFGRIGDQTQKIMVTPWEADQTLYCTPPRITNTEATLKKYALVDPEARSRSATLLRCIGDPDALMSAEIQAQCLPIDLRGDRRTLKLVKERKRKLFHNQVYESEIEMKKLYIQTAKKLPAFGCKVFQVKELVHGRTLRKTLLHRSFTLSISIWCCQHMIAFAGCSNRKWGEKRSANSFFNSVEWSRIIWREHSITCGSLKAPKVIPRTKVCERYFKGSWWTAIGIYVVSGNVVSLAAWSILIVVSSVDLTICFVRDGRIRNLSVEISSLLAPHISLAVFPSGSMTSHVLCPYAMPILFLCASGDGRIADFFLHQYRIFSKRQRLIRGLAYSKKLEEEEFP